MMVKIFYLLLFLPAAAQAQDSTVRYLNDYLQPTNKARAVYTAYVKETAKGYETTVRYDDGSLWMSMLFRDKALRSREGEFLLYYPDGKLWLKTSYRNNLLNGSWISWHPNGNLRDSGQYVNNKRIGSWMSYHGNGQPKLQETYGARPSASVTEDLPDYMQQDTRQVMELLKKANQVADELDGPYKSWYENGQLRESGQYKVGKREGEWKSWYVSGQLESKGSFQQNLAEGTWEWFHPNGKPATIETCSKGKVTDLQCFDTTGVSTGFLCNLLREPILKKEMATFEAYVMMNLVYPAVALQEGIEGDVQVSLIITKEGRMKDVTITYSSHEILEKAVTDLIKKMPQDWDPAIVHNRIMDYSIVMTIPFRLPE